MNNTTVTVKDIAAKAGVSTKTVERALSGVTLGMRKDARERAETIKALAESMGYKPSRAAQSLQSGRSHQLGLLVNNITDQYFAAAAEIAMDEAEKAGYSLHIQLMRFSPEREVACVNDLRSLGVDGILFGGAPAEANREYFQWLKEFGFPLLTLGADTPFGFPALTIDHAAALAQAVCHLRDRGHDRIRLCLPCQAKHLHAVLAREFQRACEQSNIAPDISYCRTMRELAEIAAWPDRAHIIYGKYSLRAFLDELEKGPQAHPDLIGFFNEWTWAPAPHDWLCGVIMEPAEQEVRLAVRQLIDLLEGRSEPSTQSVTSTFYPASEFDRIRAIDLSSRYLTATPDHLL